MDLRLVQLEVDCASVLSFSGTELWWIVGDQHPPEQNIPHVSFSGVIFGIMTCFQIQGSITLHNCTFLGQGNTIYLIKNRLEVDVDNFTVASPPHTLALRIRGSSIPSGLHIKTEDCHRTVDISDSSFETLLTFTGSTTSYKLLAVNIQHSWFHDMNLLLCCGDFYGTLIVHNSSFLNSRLEAYPPTGVTPLFALFFTQCLFSTRHYHQHMDFDRPAYVRIWNCVFRTEQNIDLRESLVLRTHGLNLQGDDVRFKIVHDLLHIPYTDRELPYTKVILENTLVDIKTTYLKDFAVSCKDVNLYVHNCHVSLHQEESNWVDGGVFSHSAHGGVQDFENISIDILQEKLGSVAISVVRCTITHRTSVKNVSILCPLGFEFVEKFENHHYMTCQYACPQQYSFQRGYALLGGYANEMVRNKTVPNCLECPTGASCDGDLQALPNYWGFEENGKLTMIRCPEEYCCQGSGSCVGIDSCNNGRGGLLCGACENNLTESLFSPQCVSESVCYPGLIGSLYLLCALCYALVLVAFQPLKDKILASLKHVFQQMKRCVLKNHVSGEEVPPDKDKQESDKTQDNTEEQEEEDHDGDSSMKYMQILFYYIQDASLFKIKMPNMESDQKNLVVKLIQFSPELLAAYTRLVNLCFSHDTTATTKLLFKSSFGFFVLLFILCMYLGQWTCSIILKKSFASFKGYLMQAFLLTLLFSYQKLVTGAFTMVQCVEIHRAYVLFTQSDIVCYTWWQIVVKLFIVLSLYPAFLVVAYAPFLVQSRRMSVKLFIFTCFFPVPTAVFHLTKCLSTKMKLRVGRDKSGQSDLHAKKEIEEGSASENIDMTEVEQSQLSARRENENITEISSEETPPEVSTPVYTPAAEAVLHTLLRHYKTLSIFQTPFTWLGIHKLYRVTLVACKTYITDPFVRLCVMTALLLAISVVNGILQPYKSSRANKTAALSYAASICIAFVNFGRCLLVTFDCGINCPYKTEVEQLFNITESLFLVYIPVVAVGLWFVFTLLEKFRAKSKVG